MDLLTQLLQQNKALLQKLDPPTTHQPPEPPTATPASPPTARRSSPVRAAISSPSSASSLDDSSAMGTPSLAALPASSAAARGLAAESEGECVAPVWETTEPGHTHRRDGPLHNTEASQLDPAWTLTSEVPMTPPEQRHTEAAEGALSPSSSKRLWREKDELIAQLRRDKRSLATQLFLLESEITEGHVREKAKHEARQKKRSQPVRYFPPSPIDGPHDNDNDIKKGTESPDPRHGHHKKSHSSAESEAEREGSDVDSETSDEGSRSSSREERHHTTTTTTTTTPSEAMLTVVVSYYEAQLHALQDENRRLQEDNARLHASTAVSSTTDWNRSLVAGVGTREIEQEIAVKATVTLVECLLKVPQASLSLPTSTSLSGTSTTTALLDTAEHERRLEQLMIHCIKAGAHVYYHPSRTTAPLPSTPTDGDGRHDGTTPLRLRDRAALLARPILHTLMAQGRVAVVAALLQSPRALDLRKADHLGETPLHVLCSACVDSERAVQILHGVVHRLLDPTYSTRVQWGADEPKAKTAASSSRDDFFSTAARYGRLSLFWPVVKVLPYFRDVIPSSNPPGPVFRLTQKVQPEDWAQLPGLDKSYFMTLEAQQAEEEALDLWREQQSHIATEQLLRLCRSAGSQLNDPALWKRVEPLILEQGAVVMCRDHDMPYPLLTQWMYDGAVTVVELGLQSPQSLDFTVPGKAGWTPLHAIALQANPEVMETLLRRVIERQEMFPERDRLHWSQTDQQGHTCIALAASSGHLALWWSIVTRQKHVPYYERCYQYFGLQHRPNPTTSSVSSEDDASPPPPPQRLRLTAFVQQSDWNALSPADQRCFAVVRGFK